ncbi:PE family protein [Mycobacterium riyadhense]|uniref:PE family protein n=1 Tax=Mycobacterium riyadhense TaxID=486698 RepID=UPI00194F6B75|nr:PE family protein [Mycobacterium riyadhense]
MSFMFAAPEALAAAASDIAGIGSNIGAANAAASLPTTGVLASAADAVSTQVAALLSAHGQGYQQISAQLSAFHDQFVAALDAGANSYASAESGAANTLASAMKSPAAQLLGQLPLSQNGIVASAANAVARVQSAVAGALGPSPLALMPTGGIGALAASSGLLPPLGGATASAAAAPAAVIPVSWATAIENFYLAAEPWVQYGFTLATWAAGWLPYIGLLAPQIMIFYDLFEPMVQSGLFNTLDWLSGQITFSQGLSNFWSATTASVNNFIYNEYYWIRGFFPPPPPFGSVV